MGTCRSRLPSLFGRISVFQAHETCLHISLRYITAGPVHETNKASEAGKEEETENDAAFIHVTD
ncbi:hypothetical protein LINGRAHAP2_LOCUS35854 [Linum grandiflorum]